MKKALACFLVKQFAERSFLFFSSLDQNLMGAHTGPGREHLSKGQKVCEERRSPSGTRELVSVWNAKVPDLEASLMPASPHGRHRVKVP